MPLYIYLVFVYAISIVICQQQVDWVKRENPNFIQYMMITKRIDNLDRNPWVPVLNTLIILAFCFSWLRNGCSLEKMKMTDEELDEAIKKL